jgi:uncharacterized protein involved in response to NO
MEGLFFLAGLFAIVWLAYWVAQEGPGGLGGAGALPKLRI